MKKTDRNRDTLPETFGSEEQAGEFWDTHSTADYEEYLEPVDMTIEIKKRSYIIEIDHDSFMALCQYSKKVNTPVKTLANRILKEKLAST